MVASDSGIAENIHYVSPLSRCFIPFGCGGFLCAGSKCAPRFRITSGCQCSAGRGGNEDRSPKGFWDY